MAVSVGELVRQAAGALAVLLPAKTGQAALFRPLGSKPLQDQIPPLVVRVESEAIEPAWV